MAHEILKKEPGKESQIVSIGDQSVSMQLIQSIYNEITGKKETLTRHFRDDHQATFNDIKTLNTKIEQLYEQYNVISKNCAVTLYYLNDCKEEFSSFERFEIYDSSSISPIENIRLEYNLLIILPATKQPQPYKIEVDLNSRVTLKKRAQLEIGIPRRFFGIVAKHTGRAKINYIDYTVARTFIVAIEEWFKSIPKSKPQKLLLWLQRYSEYIPFLFRFGTALTIILALFFNHINILGESSTIHNLFGVSILSIGTVYLSVLAVGRLGRICEESIDFYQSVSGVKLNRGDELAFSEFSSQNRLTLIKLGLSTIFMVAINIFSAWLASTLGV
jgi:hypothetical protein